MVRMGILVEQASCLFHVPASWWNEHLGGIGILPVRRSIRAGKMPTLRNWLFPSGQDAHSTKLVIPDSRFPIPDSRFPLLPKYLLNF
ncbi:MAG: hypothetical protein F6K63_25995 [Moorea sp. SIO1G6]|uniref:hypothetical protein n=1 Tax=Moorena sp. SIO1G6 TaxID=2607840 RepID=UPI0013BF100D|nr:hypothetical protein [Moorena sp. SIO1G6]NES86268.1 hypothetical protein [Moorena sp. SIO2B7]NET67649.1 hypothetical protein [Moorena sp. SIO1G6]